MSIDGKLLYRAKSRLAEMRRQNETELLKRTAQVYKDSPAVKELDEEIRKTVSDVIGLALKHGKDVESAVEEIGDENQYLQSERKRELVIAGYPADYLDEKYFCPICHDTGYVGTEMCSCLKKLYMDEQRKELSALLKLGSETFDSFDLDWYTTEKGKDEKVSPRENMECIYETCVQYSRKFGKNSLNLFMSGGTGLGKTFLSTCIAKVVSERGFSVVYDTACSVFEKFEQEKFSKSDDMDQLKNDLRRYMTCDLLIIDDLGTEMTTSFTVSVLYNIINTRLITNKKTIINSNLTKDDMVSRYSPQIVSRLEGEYHVLLFSGQDIRLQKKANQF